MNLVQIGTNEFFPQLIRLTANKGTYSPARTATRNWGDAGGDPRASPPTCGLRKERAASLASLQFSGPFARGFPQL
jgi:hypothetical protein